MKNLKMKKMKKCEDVKKYWTKNSEKFGGCNKVVEVISKYISKNCKGKLHELGCSSGANLNILHKKCRKLILTGNDINEKRVEEGNQKETINIILADTVEFVQKQKDNSFDYILTASHLVHIPNNFDDILSVHIPRITKKYIFCREWDPYNKINRPRKYYRDYRNFFKGVKLIEEVEISKNYSYRIFVFQKEEMLMKDFPSAIKKH